MKSASFEKVVIFYSEIMFIVWNKYGIDFPQLPP